MNRMSLVLCLPAVLLLAGASALAQETSDRILFRGEVIDGPFVDRTIDGFCKRRARGDSYRQVTRCVVTMGDGYRIVDPQASIEIVGGNRALRIVLGPGMRSGDLKGNFKISAFQATTFYDREVTLHDLPEFFVAAEVGIGGVSVAAGTSTTNPDCLIWDIVGDGVFR